MKKYKLDHIVREYMIESLGALQVDQRYSRFLQIAISGLRDLNMDVKGLIKVLRVDIDQSNFTATLPNDYLNYRKISVCSNGQQIALSVNLNMCDPDFNDCGNLVVDGVGDANSSTEGFFYPWSTNYSFNAYGQYTGRQYGVGGGNNAMGYYRIFEDEGYMAIQGASTMYDEIVIEYLADLEQVDGETYVHPNDVEAIKAWMYWKYIQRSEKYPMGEKESARRAYGLEKKKARRRHTKFNINDLISAVNSGKRSSPNI